MCVHGDLATARRRWLSGRRAPAASRDPPPRVPTKVPTRSRLRRAQAGTLGHLCGQPTIRHPARLKTKKPPRSPANPGLRRGLLLRGSGRSRTDDGGFAIRCLSHLATEPWDARRTLRHRWLTGQGVRVAENLRIPPPGAILPVLHRVSASTGPRLQSDPGIGPRVPAGSAAPRHERRALCRSVDLPIKSPHSGPAPGARGTGRTARRPRSETAWDASGDATSA